MENRQLNPPNLKYRVDLPGISHFLSIESQILRIKKTFCYFFELKELIDVKPETDNCYIRSVCEPFDIEMELDLRKAENWLTHFGLYPYTQIHASGHLNYDEVRDVVETVEPKVLIPVHTQHPEVFHSLHDNVILPEKGVAIAV